MEVTEHKAYSKDYLDPNKRSISNAVQVHFTDGTATGRIECEYPLGHRFRRKKPFEDSCQVFSKHQHSFFIEAAAKIEEACEHSGRMQKLSVSEFMDLFLV